MGSIRARHKFTRCRSRHPCLRPRRTHSSHQERATQQRIAKEFSTAILAFQRSQKASAEKLKHQIAREQKRTVGEMDEEGGGPDSSDS